MIFNFYINDVEVEEPVGFDGTTIKLKRSDKWHGVMVESNDNKLQFYGDGYRMLKALYDASGIDAVAVFKEVQLKCVVDSARNNNHVIYCCDNFLNNSSRCRFGIIVPKYIYIHRSTE